MDRKYIAVMDQEKDGFGIVFPDFPGCVTTGKNMNDALRRAREALELHLQAMVKDGDRIPEESDLEKVSEWVAECEGKTHLAWIGVNLPVSKAVRINITIPENLLRQVDKKLAGRKNRRSAFFANAVKRELVCHNG